VQYRLVTLGALPVSKTMEVMDIDPQQSEHGEIPDFNS